MANAVTSLARISKAITALAAAKTLDDVLQIRDQAEALRVYIKAASQGLEAANAAAEIKLRAERKAGEMLSGKVKRGGDRAKSHDATLLSDLGLSRDQ